MSTIGEQTFIRLSGPQMPALAKNMAVISRQGKDGAVFRADAKKVPDVPVRGLAVTETLGSAQTAIDTYQALIGTLVTVVDDLGRSTSNVMVLGVQVDRVQFMTTPSPSTAVYWVYSSWLLKPTG